MPRVTSKRIDTTSLQGEDSYIVIRPVSWKTAKQARAFLAIGDVSLRTDMTNQQKVDHMAQESALTEECLFTSVVEWNWADESGKPLPVPRKTEDLDLLTSEEVQFLLSVSTGASVSTDLKNSESGPSITSGSGVKITPLQTNG